MSSWLPPWLSQLRLYLSTSWSTTPWSSTNLRLRRRSTPRRRPLHPQPRTPAERSDASTQSAPNHHRERGPARRARSLGQIWTHCDRLITPRTATFQAVPHGLALLPTTVVGSY